MITILQYERSTNLLHHSYRLPGVLATPSASPDVHQPSIIASNHTHSFSLCEEILLMLLLPGHLALAIKEVILVGGRGLEPSYAPCMHCTTLEPFIIRKGEMLASFAVFCYLP